ncbi:hypothetical protein PC114_g18219 [Phytophthora cactorum]|uniref:Uncharacterized protein n=1 Tax=Phytophthora cactorum TaxID=29920 RepID=A0A8T1CC37_9STRA|nr:hypothetical protein PC114_g18219 [Phytophthora cactorum]KAG2900861.1 hypothetical protein PC115_g16056 [Phytophthora cactorum]KAG2916671.1 hypothetical protein PC117_g17685 [Phytophthora cactorum]KAG3189363.1 hypothetical protein PC128_g11807 [Phytophthora cactorum]KAG4046968.1 hypothetical protein PC123_g17662 [Phytophthora cactorum]
MIHASLECYCGRLINSVVTATSTSKTLGLAASLHFVHKKNSRLAVDRVPFVNPAHWRRWQHTCRPVEVIT